MKKEYFEIVGGIACMLSSAVVLLGGYIFLALLLG